MTEFAPPNTTNPDLAAVLGAPAPEVAKVLHPEHLAPQATLGETINVLHRLPHLAIGNDLLSQPEGPHTGQRIEGASFPVSRIVGVAKFDSWAGRGLKTNGDAEEVGTYSSAGSVHFYSHREEQQDYEPEITLFKDNQGEVWGSTIEDGSHRTAGAKLRGDNELVCTVYTDDYDRLPVVDINVAEMLLEQAKQRGSFIGRVMLDREVERLTAASEKVEQAAVAVPEDYDPDFI